MKTKHALITIGVIIGLAIAIVAVNTYRQKSRLHDIRVKSLMRTDGYSRQSAEDKLFLEGEGD